MRSTSLVPLVSLLLCACLVPPSMLDGPTRGDAGEEGADDPDLDGARARLDVTAAAHGRTTPPADGPPDVDRDGAAGGPSGTDCDDADPSRHPAATEVPYDAVDQDCDGADLVDVDRDGAAGGTSGTDCDDADPSRHPAATEVPYDAVDQDCDGADLVDVDRDGAAGGPSGTDCDDADPSRHPNAHEVCGDGIDQDCDPTPFTCGLAPEVADADAHLVVRTREESGLLGLAMVGGADLTGDGALDLLASAPCTSITWTTNGCGGTVYAVPVEHLGAGGTVDVADVAVTRLFGGGPQLLGVGLAAAFGGGAPRLYLGDPGYENGDDQGGMVMRVSAPLPAGTLSPHGFGAWVAGGREGVTIGERVAALPGPDGDTLITVERDLGTGRTSLVWALPGGPRAGGWPLTSAWDVDHFVAGRQTSSSFDPVDVAAGEDVTGDADPDVAVAAIGITGRGRVVVLPHPLPAPSLDLWAQPDAPVWEVPGGAVLSTLRVLLAPDLTGDGRSDLVVAMPCVDAACTDGGTVWVVPGGTSVPGGLASLGDVGGVRAGAAIVGTSAGSGFGSSLAAADVDGNGVSDLVVGAPDANGARGAVHVVYGPIPLGRHRTPDASGALVTTRLSGTPAQVGFGWSVAGLGDLDDDGADEIAVGAPWANTSEGEAGGGRLYVFRGGGD